MIENNNTNTSEYFTTTSLNDWQPSTVLCPNCGSDDTYINDGLVLTTAPPQYSYKCQKCNHHWSSYAYNRKYLGTCLNYNPPKINEYPVSMGWICPKCGGVYSPTMYYCMKCTNLNTPFVSGTSVKDWTITTISSSNDNTIATTQAQINSNKRGENKL